VETLCSIGDLIDMQSEHYATLHALRGELYHWFTVAQLFED
jgi:hypothetical protein